MNARLMTSLLSSAFGILLTACQTPEPVFELAEKSSANAGVFQQELARMDALSKALAGDRAGHVAGMDAFNKEFEAYIKRELYMREKSMDAGDWGRRSRMLTELTRLRDELIKIEEGARFARQERRKAILEKHVGLATHQAALRETANALSALAKREDSAARAAFIGRFLGDVHKEVKDTLEKNEGAAKHANELLNRFKDDAKDGDRPKDGAPETKAKTN